MKTHALKCLRCDGVVVERRGAYRHRSWWRALTCRTPVVVTDWEQTHQDGSHAGTPGPAGDDRSKETGGEGRTDRPAGTITAQE